MAQYLIRVDHGSTKKQKNANIEYKFNVKTALTCIIKAVIENNIFKQLHLSMVLTPKDILYIITLHIAFIFMVSK